MINEISNLLKKIMNIISEGGFYKKTERKGNVGKSHKKKINI